MAAPTLHNTTTSGWADTSSHTITRPTRNGGGAAQVGDLLVAFIFTRGGTGEANTQPAGFTFFDRVDVSTSLSIMASYRYVGAGEAASYAVNLGTARVSRASITLISGTASSSPVDAYGENSDTTLNDHSRVPSLTPTKGEGLLLCAWCVYGTSLVNASTLADAPETTEIYSGNSGALVTSRHINTLAYQILPNNTTATGIREATSSANHDVDARMGLIIAKADPITTQKSATFALAAGFLPLKQIDHSRAYSLALSMPTPVSGRAYEWAAQFALSLATSVQKTQERIRVYSIAPVLYVQKTANRTRTYALTLVRATQKRFERISVYTLALGLNPAKLFNRLRIFALSANFAAAGALSRVAAAATQNLEAFMQILRGRRGTIPLSYRIVKSNVSGEDLGALRSWVVGTGSVSMSNSRAHAWELSFDMRQTSEIDPVRDYVKVYADIALQGEIMSYPLGLYRLRKPSGALAKNYRTWTCQGFSLEDLLAHSDADNGYSVWGGVDLLGEARDIVVERAGIPDDRVLLPAATATARHAIQFDPGQDTSTANWLSIANALLNAAGYYAWQTDAEGNFVTEKMGSRAVMRPDVHYDEAYENMVVGSIADAWDDERFANKIVVRSQDVADTPPLIAKAFNRNPNSEGSIDYLGRVIQKTISLQTATTLAEMQVMAQAELEKASGYYRKLSVMHLFDPRVFIPRCVYGVTLTDSDGEILVDGTWNQVNASVSLSDPPSAVTAEISRIEEV